MIEGAHVRKQVCAAVREVVRRMRLDEDIGHFVDSVHEALDEMKDTLLDKRDRIARAHDVPPPEAVAGEAPKKAGKKKAGKKKAGKKKAARR